MSIAFDRAALRAAIGKWYDLLPEAVLDKTVAIADQVQQRRDAGETVYPPRPETFRALAITQPDQVKCVILGQDPYHGPGQANGLAFSVAPDCKIPPSLRNIYKELAADTGCAIPKNGDLTGWAEQGVLLLNAALSVEEKKPGSHAGLGWQELTAAVLHVLMELPQPIVFLLWGRFAADAAKAAGKGCAMEKKLLLTAAHPSPLSASHGFFGCRPFSQANAFLTENGVSPVQWAL